MPILHKIPLLLAPAPAADVQPTLASSISMLALPIAMIALLYFLMIRPQRKQEKKQREERGKLKVGDAVVTIGGVVGKIVNIKDDDITIATSVAQTLMTFRREAINSVIRPVSDTPQRSTSTTAKDAAADKPQRKGLFGRGKKDQDEM